MQNIAKGMLILITNSSIAPRETDTPIIEPVTLVVVQHVITAEERVSPKIVALLIVVVGSKNKIDSVLQCMKVFSKMHGRLLMHSY